jgi:hypothetical protein
MADDDRWFDLTGLAAYSGLSPRTIRRYMADPDHPLPVHRLARHGKERGPTLVSKREFDEWVTSFPGTVAPRGRADFDAKVQAAAKSMRGC